MKKFKILIIACIAALCMTAFSLPMAAKADEPAPAERAVYQVNGGIHGAAVFTTQTFTAPFKVSFEFKMDAYMTWMAMSFMSADYSNLGSEANYFVYGADVAKIMGFETNFVYNPSNDIAFSFNMMERTKLTFDVAEDGSMVLYKNDVKLEGVADGVSINSVKAGKEVRIGLMGGDGTCSTVYNVKLEKDGKTSFEDNFAYNNFETGRNLWTIGEVMKASINGGSQAYLFPTAEEELDREEYIVKNGDHGAAIYSTETFKAPFKVSYELKIDTYMTWMGLSILSASYADLASEANYFVYGADTAKIMGFDTNFVYNPSNDIIFDFNMMERTKLSFDIASDGTVTLYKNDVKIENAANTAVVSSVLNGKEVRVALMSGAGTFATVYNVIVEKGGKTVFSDDFKYNNIEAGLNLWTKNVHMNEAIANGKIKTYLFPTAVLPIPTASLADLASKLETGKTYSIDPKAADNAFTADQLTVKAEIQKDGETNWSDVSLSSLKVTSQGKYTLKVTVTNPEQGETEVSKEFYAVAPATGTHYTADFNNFKSDLFETNAAVSISNNKLMIADAVLGSTFTTTKTYKNFIFDFVINNVSSQTDSVSVIFAKNADLGNYEIEFTRAGKVVFKNFFVDKEVDSLFNVFTKETHIRIEVRGEKVTIAALQEGQPAELLNEPFAEVSGAVYSGAIGFKFSQNANYSVSALKIINTNMPASGETLEETDPPTPAPEGPAGCKKGCKGALGMLNLLPLAFVSFIIKRKV